MPQKQTNRVIKFPYIVDVILVQIKNIASKCNIPGTNGQVSGSRLYV